MINYAMKVTDIYEAMNSKGGSVFRVVAGSP